VLTTTFDASFPIDWSRYLDRITAAKHDPVGDSSLQTIASDT